MARRSIVKFEEGLRAQVDSERQKLSAMLEAEEARAAQAKRDIDRQTATVDTLEGVLDDLSADVTDDEGGE